MSDYTVQNPILKVISAFVLSFFGSWSEAAAFVATIYTIILVCEWLVKKLLSLRAWLKVRKARTNEAA